MKKPLIIFCKPLWEISIKKTEYSKIITTMCATTAIFIILVVVLFFCFFPKKYHSSIKQYAQLYGVSQELVYAVCNCESGFDPNAKSRKGAEGIMQIMPSTMKWCCEKLGVKYEPKLAFDPDFNIKIGTYYLSYLFTVFDNESDVISAYNAGEGNVRKWKSGNGEPFRETQIYLNRVKFSKKVYRLLI